MTLSLIVAIAENGVIGNANQLPWHIPEDLRFFKQVTWGKPVIMGRKTYLSIGRPLPGRANFVVTGTAGWRADGVTALPGLTHALALCPEGEVFVIGGRRLFEEALTVAQRLYITEVHRAYDGDVLFPSWNPDEWSETSRRRIEGDPPISFVSWERV